MAQLLRVYHLASKSLRGGVIYGGFLAGVGRIRVVLQLGFQFFNSLLEVGDFSTVVAAPAQAKGEQDGEEGKDDTTQMFH